jgi:serine/threonine protein kinase
MNGTSCLVYKLNHKAISANTLPIYFRTIEELATNNHPNTINVYGVCQDTNGNIYTVLESQANGNLRHVLDLDIGYQLTWDSHFHDICIDICKAIEHYHSRGMIHNGITSSGIYVDTLKRVSKLGRYDLFGQEHRHNVYLAPEVILDHRSHSQASDVFAFGIIIYEMISRKKPWETHNTPNSIDTHRPEFPMDDTTPKYVAKLYLDCTSYGTSNRPTIASVLKLLSNMKFKM